MTSTPSTDGKSRIHFIDTARGLLLYWMIVIHSLTLAGIPRDNLLWLLQPGGWATTGFIMLSGFSIALVFFESARGYIISRNRILHRAKEVAIIAYLSNLLFTSIKLIVESTFSTDAVLKIATLQYKWSISAILVPIALFILISPVMIQIASKISPWLLLILTFIINALVGSISMYTPEFIQSNVFYQICFTYNSPYFNFPVIGFTCLAMLSFSSGVLFKRGLLTQKSWMIITPVFLIIYFLYKIYPSVSTIVPDYILHFIKFFASVGFAIIICNLRYLQFLQMFLGLLGRSSLLIFVTHRIFLHGMVIFFTLLMIPRQEWVAVVMIVTTMITSGVLCWIKNNNKWIAKSMKSIGF